MLSFYRSTIGKKVIVALTGLVLFGFLVGHLIGNLQIFLGPEKINLYARFLHGAGELLWGTRILLLICAFFHVTLSIQLKYLNLQSRPIPYAVQEPIQSTLPSRVMIWSGVFLGLYIITHLLHQTFGVYHPGFRELDIYSNVVGGFQIWYVSTIYIAGMIALGFHLYHAMFSVFQTLGINNPQINKYRRIVSIGSAVVISGGFISIPVAVLLGVLK